MCAGAEIPSLTPSRPLFSTRTSIPSPMTMPWFRLRVMTSTMTSNAHAARLGRAPSWRRLSAEGRADGKLNGILALVTNDLAADHATWIDHDRGAQIRRLLPRGHSHDRQPEQRLALVGLEPRPIRRIENLYVSAIEERWIDGEERWS